jgi:hypothetical protein
MPIEHRYLKELETIEQESFFCGVPIKSNSNILIIGTFNPSNDSCLKQNNAEWFYGRRQSKFWKYLPTALTGDSLHPSDNHAGYPQTWKQYCINNKIVIIDLIKKINVDEILPNFGDREVECKIKLDLTNTDLFDIRSAFEGITFNKVLYSLTWSDSKIQRLKQIRNIINQSLLAYGCINNKQQIKYCLTPSRNDAYQSWHYAIN